MANLKYKTRGMRSPQGIPRVYFCCHPKDFARFFESISDEILAKQNCAIWYDEEPSAERDEEFYYDLKQMQLFVMPVTSELLYTPNRALSEEFKFAIENHIPVLPLMQESGLDEAFNEKCGDLQFLSKYSTDPTAISYDEKLEKYLSSVLIGDELAEKVRAAFDAYVFLSYRKKDRRHAQELMRLIHKNEFCRDIAIWYDEFLTPGENFNDSIKDALQKSGLFVLAVTPNLVNEINYIMTTEYPMAREEGKPILPAELVPTDRKLLSEKYDAIPECTDAHNEEQLSSALLDSIKRMAIKENDNSPEHNFFIGLAYLSGIDVEVDHERAVKLITFAAEKGLIEAVKELVSMYHNGKGVAVDYTQVVLWQKRLVDLLDLTKKGHDIESATKMLYALMDLGEYYREVGEYEDALETYTRMLDIASQYCNGKIISRLQAYFLKRKKVKKMMRLLSIAHEKCGNMYERLCDTDSALDHYSEALKLKAANVSLKDEKSLVDMLWCYCRIGIIFKEIGNFDKAFEYLEKSFNHADFIYELHGSRMQLPYLFIEAGTVFLKKGEVQTAIDSWKKSIQICNEILESEPNELHILDYLITSYNLIGLNIDKDALDYYFKALEKVNDYLKLHNDYTVFREKAHTLSFISMCYRREEDFLNAEKYEKESLEIRKKLYDTFENDCNREHLSLSYMNLAVIYKCQKNYVEARRYYEKSYALLCESKTHSLSISELISTALYMMATIDDEDIDRDILKKAYDFQKKLVSENPSNKEILMRLNVIEELLEKK